ncbi:hypothetical protein [Aureibacter tunicatorum]|uniref:Porin n=1 Tax=Aureibacter tunicatorum TaxID=866807 RepID=A0AAE4BSK2_9BACT|nr:hypothetical protein [Aureibacter tunicatorum]MDR6239861.1 hypothetical protein [Aureibacter tunicatorum]BDD04336.1 hypothetical protein AUTU_18190 [Aureibacter tunicatorum]
MNANYRFFSAAILIIAAVILPLMAQAQFEFLGNGGLQYYRSAGLSGVNVFETPKNDTTTYSGFKVRVGGDFALQFQMLDQSNTNGNTANIGSDFNLPAANLKLDVQLYDGMRMHLTTYLASRHHNEAWVKGGYMQIDKLDFIKKDFLKEVMQYTSVRVGLDEINYGDAHFRRTDNANATQNPFVGNYLMDAFTTEAFMEATVQAKNLLVVAGVSNGKLNQSVQQDQTGWGSSTVTGQADNKPSFYGKLGYDNQVNSDLRVRLTGSWYVNKSYDNGTYMYGGDRAGSRYYHVTSFIDEDGNLIEGGDFSGRVNPGFRSVTNWQINPFVKYRGLEFFGAYEVSAGDVVEGDEFDNGKYTQIAGDLIYRFGHNENFYVGGRYNLVNGEDYEGAAEKKIQRYNAVFGWFLTQNVVAKLEYVNQKYKGDGYAGSNFDGYEFNGIMIEAAISF